MMISADPKEMFGALKHFCLEDFLFARSVFEVFCFGVRCWVMSRNGGKKQREGRV